MKKITIFFVLFSVLIFNMFSNPVIPKIDNYFKSVHPLPKDDFLLYCNNSGQNVYKVFSVVNKNEYCFYFDNISYVTGITISLSFVFKSESELDEFVESIDTSDLENEFNHWRRQLIKMDMELITSYDENNKIKKVSYCYTY